MKEIFERLWKENKKAFVKSFKREPIGEELESIRQITYVQTAFILATKKVTA